jgi:hypothetical protein
MALVVVEYQFATAPTEEAVRKLETCLLVREVQRVASYRARDGLRQVSIFEASDAESVREAHRSSSMPFAACWNAHPAS